MQINIARGENANIEIGNGETIVMYRRPNSTDWFIKSVDKDYPLSPTLPLMAYSGRAHAEVLGWQDWAFPSKDAAVRFAKQNGFGVN